ncbi:MAG: hypothetical protein OEM98_18105, partial [Gammaproteobacteria bacterium]|nr:hypothetical protein [Gammaproteobacteria bacterium]
ASIIEPAGASTQPVPGDEVLGVKPRFGGVCFFAHRAFRLGKKTAQVEKPCAAVTSIQQEEETGDTDFFIPAF